MLVTEQTCAICGATPALHECHNDVAPWLTQYACDACTAELSDDPPQPRKPNYKRDCAICGKSVDTRDYYGHRLDRNGRSAHRGCLPRTRYSLAPPDGHRDRQAYEEYLAALDHDRLIHDRG